MAERPLWTLSPLRVLRSALTAFQTHVQKATGHELNRYDDLWRWSITEPDSFWAELASFFGVRFHSQPDAVLADSTMPGAIWFPGATLNYAEQALSHTGDGIAIVGVGEDGSREQVTWDELRARVGSVASWLRGQGIQPGDRVAGYLPNVVPAVVVFLAAASIGAVWSVCSEEYSPSGAADRFGQLEPVLLVTADGYHYAGRRHDRREQAAELRRLLPTVRAVLWVKHLGYDDPTDVTSYDDIVSTDAALVIDPVPFDHPLWVVYSSGTTGRPKGIVHGHGGVILEHLKFLGLHLDLGPDTRFHWFTTTSWIMWPIQVSGLLLGSTIVLYDGSPGWPQPDALWDLASAEHLTMLGTSAAYLASTHKTGRSPAQGRDLSALQSLGSTGSPLPAPVHAWINEVLPDVWLVPASGGTDIASAFAAGVPTEPAWPGEMQGRCLGVAMAAWDGDGHEVIDQVGELVVTQPLPSMPLYFWDDADGSRYRESYFTTYPGVWRHGDWVTITRDGTVVIHGRSDATLNKFGVRIGSSEIYEVIDQLPEIRDCLAVGVEQPDGGYWMPLFVVVADGITASAELAERLRALIRTQVSPRHVPDEVIFTTALPHTMTGKRMEVPVKRLLQGSALEKTVNPSAVDDPSALDQFVRLAETRAATPTPDRAPADGFPEHCPNAGDRRVSTGRPQ